LRSTIVAAASSYHTLHCHLLYTLTVSVVDFGISVADHALEIYRSSEGVLDQNLQIQTMATDLTLITADLQSSIAVSEKLGLVRNAQELMKTARDCHKSSRQLLEALSRLKVDGERTKWKAIGRSLYTA